MKLEHVSEKFAGLWTDLEQEKQVGVSFQPTEPARAPSHHFNNVR